MKHKPNLPALGALISVTGLLHSAAETFAKPDVSGYKLRRQAGRVMDNCTKAIESASKHMIVKSNGQRTVRDATLRQMTKVSEAFVRIASSKMEKRQLYCPEFVCARVMACHYAIDAMRHKHGMGREWAMLEQVTATMLGMLLSDMPEQEAQMFAITEDFYLEVAA